MDDPFNYNILDDQVNNLPELNNVPELADLNNEYPVDHNFSLMDPQPSPEPFPVQVVDHERNNVIVDANTGGLLSNGNELPEDAAIWNADPSIRQEPNSQRHSEPSQGRSFHFHTQHIENGHAVHQTHAEQVANPSTRTPITEQAQEPSLHAHLHHPHPQHTENTNVHAVAANVNEVARQPPPPRRAPAKRKRNSKKATVNNNMPPQSHSAAMQSTMVHNSNVPAENSTNPNFLPRSMANVQQNTHGMATMQTAVQQNVHGDMNIPPSQVNVTRISHITAPTESAPAPQLSPGTPLNQSLPNPATPSRVQPQQNATNLTNQLVQPASPLGRLPVDLQDLLMNQARSRSYSGAEFRAMDMAQNAAVRIHSMIQNGQLMFNLSTPNTPRAIIPPRQCQAPSHPSTPRGNVSPQEIQPAGTQPPPKIRRTTSKTSNRAQSSMTPPQPSPTPEMVAVHPPASATGTQVIPPRSFPCTPVFSDVTRLPSQELSRVSSADFQTDHLTVPRHPLTPVPTRNLGLLGEMIQANVQGQQTEPGMDPQERVSSPHMAAPPPTPQHPLTPIAPGNIEGSVQPNVQGQENRNSRVHPKTPVAENSKRPVTAKNTKQPVSRMQSKKPISRRQRKRTTAPKHKRQAPQHPNRVHSYPAHMMDPTANLSPGAGPSHIPVTARSTTIAEVAAQAMSATFHDMGMQAPIAPTASATPGGGSNLAGPSSATYEQLLAGGGGQVPQVPHHPGYPQASVSPAIVDAHHRAKHTYGKKLRFSRNAKASNYCHICGRSGLTVRITDCANLKIGLCRKVLCEKCLIIYDPYYVDWSQTQHPSWFCLHCRRFCPDNARCAQYTRNNAKRKERNEEKKLLKRKKKSEEKQKDLKRRNSDRRDDPGDSPTGVADNNVF